MDEIFTDNRRENISTKPFVFIRKDKTMNKNQMQQIFTHYIDNFEKLNDPEHSEYYKWQVCHKFRPLRDEALVADVDDFADALYQVKDCRKNIIDSYTQPFYGLVEFARREPETVQQMYIDLYSDDGGDVKMQMELIKNFFDQSNELLDKYFPDSHLYRQNSHSVSSYLFLYDPDHHYMYKATQSQAMADCIEFYDDWGSGDNIKLDVYYRMCDEILEEIRNCPELLATNKSRYDGNLHLAPGELHPDSKLHILLFDIIYCSHVYNLFDGIAFARPKSKEKQLIIEQKNKAKALKAAYEEAKQKADYLDEALHYFVETIKEAGIVKHMEIVMYFLLTVSILSCEYKRPAKTNSWAWLLLFQMVSFRWMCQVLMKRKQSTLMS